MKIMVYEPRKEGSDCERRIKGGMQLRRVRLPHAGSALVLETTSEASLLPLQRQPYLHRLCRPPHPLRRVHPTPC